MQPATIPVCDHRSVGILVFQEKRLLLIDRKRPPFGLAAPAGHVDGHGSVAESEESQFLAAAEAELQEEVGLCATKLKLIKEGRKDNHCRRPDGTWHYWRVYLAETTGEVAPCPDETKGYTWCGYDEMFALLKSEGITLRGKQHHLEPVWREWFEEINILIYL